jgi:Bacterial regulatory proteins, luxR family
VRAPIYQPRPFDIGAETSAPHGIVDLAIGEQTVKTHVRGILTKLDLQDRAQAAIFALRHETGMDDAG